MKQKEQLTKRQLAAPYIANFIGSIIAAIGINAFFIPHHLLSSGIGGAAIMVYYATGLPFGMGNFIMNIPVLIACYRFMGRRYTILAIIGTFIYSFILDSLSFLADMSVIHDPMTAAITGGILNGIGMGIIYRYNGNTGGLDVVGAIVKKFYSFEMGNVVMAVNTFILIFAAYMFGLELAVLTFIGSYVTAFLTNKVVIGLNQRKAVTIITNRPEQMAGVIMRYIGHGVTFIQGKGAYTMQEKQIIYAIIKLTEVSKLKEIVNKVDPRAFMIISDASNVFGTGFTEPSPKFHENPGDSMSMPRTRKPLPPNY